MNPRALPFLFLFLASAACGSSAPISSSHQGLGGGGECSDIAIMRGLSLDIDPAFAPKVSAAAVSVCWAGSCRTPTVNLMPATKTVDNGCNGQTCSGEAVPTGGKFAYIEVADLPAESVQVTLDLTDASGTALPPQTLAVVPKIVYPGGPECGGGTPQAKLVVAADGSLRAGS